jgi:uncharacterized phage protein (TIGR02218 family)
MTLSTCWIITKNDGSQLFFTDHDDKLTINGQEYSPVDGFDASARQRADGLDENNWEARGAISSSLITEDDIREGLYDGAKVTELLVDWQNVFYSPLIITEYFVQQMRWNDRFWEAEMAGLPARFKSKFGRRITRNCMWTLGDSRCKYDVTALQDTGIVLAVSSNHEFISSGISPVTDGYWDNGICEFTSGDNSGFKSEILTNVGTTFTLAFSMPYAIAGGNAIKLTPGCDKTQDTCVSKFNNIINFGGFPTVPGQDRLFRGADSSGDGVLKK